MAKKLLPDVVLMDLPVPEKNGIEVIHVFNDEKINHKTIVLTIQSSQHFVTQALGAGAKGYVLKDCTVEELIDSVHIVAADSVYLSPRISEVIARGYENRAANPGSPSGVTISPREIEVAQLISEGKNSKEMACVLGLSIKTIESHRANIMKKLNCRTLADLIKYAIREGITSL
jgi:two-component system response regulator NreC